MGQHRIAQTARDLGLATWFGGGLMAAVGLEPSLAVLDDPHTRAKLANTAWGRWGPVNTVGIGAYLAGAARLASSRRGRNRPRALVAGSVTGLALAASGYSAWQGLRMTGQTEDTSADTSSTTASGAETTRRLAREAARTSAGPAPSNQMLRLAGWTVPAATGCLIVLSATRRR